MWMPTNGTADAMNAKTKAARNLIDLKEEFKRVQTAIKDQLAELAQTMTPGETVEVDDTVYEWKDNFADTNTVFRPACVHRFDLAELK